jgi:hypothetical protein
VRRDVQGGKVWTAAPVRVLADDGHVLRTASWPGIESLVPTTWTQWLTTGDDAVRRQGIPNLAAGTWELERWTWRDTVVIAWTGVDPDFGIHRFVPVDGGPGHWYINFERPARRTPIGIDTFVMYTERACRSSRLVRGPVTVPDHVVMWISEIASSCDREVECFSTRPALSCWEKSPVSGGMPPQR